MSFEPQSQSQDQAQSRRIFVVEDDVLLRLDISAEFRDAGYEVFEAASAEDALQLIASGYRPHAVFSDLKVAGNASGWDLRHELAHRCPDVVFVLTSGREPPVDPEEAGLIFLPKPYRSERVVVAIEEALGRNGRNDGTI